MVKWYVVQCFQSAVSAIWANRMTLRGEEQEKEMDLLAVRNLCEHWVPLMEH